MLSKEDKKIQQEAQEALVALIETKQKLEDKVLETMRDPDLPIENLVELRNKYLEFLEKLDEIEDYLKAQQHGSEADWLGYWKGY